MSIGDKLRITTAKKSRDIRYERVLLPSTYRVVVPIVEDPTSQFTISLVPTDEEVARALAVHEEQERKDAASHPKKYKKKKFEPPEVYGVIASALLATCYNHSHSHCCTNRCGTSAVHSRINARNSRDFYAVINHLACCTFVCAYAVLLCWYSSCVT